MRSAAPSRSAPRTVSAHRASRYRFGAGSFGRYDVEAESGGRRGAFGYYLAGSLTSEDGWRDHSPSTVRRVFGDAGWRGTDSQVNVSFTGASNDLTGNGPAPLELLDEDYEAVFTYPDRTDNDIAMAAVRFLGRRDYGQLDGVVYYRHSGSRTFNGDAAEPDEEEGADSPFDAINNRSHTRTQSAGFTGQLSRRKPLAGRDNDLVIGAGLDTAATRFDFSSEWAYLTDDRGTIGKRNVRRGCGGRSAQPSHDRQRICDQHLVTDGPPGADCLGEVQLDGRRSA